MIPKDTTPIKHKILTDIFAKRRLTLDEIAIVSYIIRWSWGFNGIEGRRQDWTRKLTKRKIAKNIGMNEGQFNRVINKMIIENKIIVKDKCYQFNEHFDKWKLDKKSSSEKLDKKASKTCGIVKLNLTNKQVKLDKSSSLGMPNNQGEGIKNKDHRGGEHMSKDNKDTYKDNKEEGTINKKLYLDEVYLTDDEYHKLIDDYGKEKIKDYLAYLNRYIVERIIPGKRRPYQSHYLTIRAWIRKDEKRKLEDDEPERPDVRKELKDL